MLRVFTLSLAESACSGLEDIGYNNNGYNQYKLCKTDMRDADNIARCLAFHTYSGVYVPDDKRILLRNIFVCVTIRSLCLRRLNNKY